MVSHADPPSGGISEAGANVGKKRLEDDKAILAITPDIKHPTLESNGAFSNPRRSHALRR